jgi:predicted transcriptional regulator
MMPKTHMIELDEATAAALKKRADERGVSVPDLVAQYLDEDQAPVDGDTEQVRELDRRWAAVQAGQPTVKHEKVVRWLDSWGTSAFKPWRDQ